MTEKTEVAVLDATTTQVAGYRQFYTDLIQLEKDNKSVVFDIATKKGEKECRSHIFSLRKSKGALERVRKEAKAESLRIGRAIDSEAEAIEARIEAMIEVHQKPLDEAEAREKERVAALQSRIAAFTVAQCNTTDEVRAEIARIEAIEIGADWQEFMAQATTDKEKSLTTLQTALATFIKRDEEAAELARLRAETAAREQAEREAAIARAAAEKAQREAEEKAAAEAAKAAKAIADAKAEAERKEAAAALALKQERERALAEQEAAARREMQLKLEAEQAEARRIAQAEEAKRQQEEAAKRAEEEKQRAVKAEQDRIAAEAKRVADEAVARERNREHKAAINRAALESLIAGGIPEEFAKAAVTLIAQGKVANVAISY